MKRVTLEIMGGKESEREKYKKGRVGEREREKSGEREAEVSLGKRGERQGGKREMERKAYK